MLYTEGKTECTPRDVGYNEKRIDVLNNHFQTLVDDNEIYGAAYCISRKGKVFASGAVGYKTYKKEPDLLVAPDDIHYIASMTKTFVGVAIMKLVEDGITRLDVSVGEILPQFKEPPFNGITLFHLLTHTSGMHPDGGCFPNQHNPGGYWDFIGNGYYTYKAKNPKKKEEFDWIAAALAHGVRDLPDKQWMYCSFGFAILGAVIEKITGIRAEKYIEENICNPLGMNDTMFDLSPEKAGRFMIHDKEIEKSVNNLLNGSEDTNQKEEPWNLIPSTGGGMKSSVQDIIRYGNMVLYNGTFDNVRILGRKANEKMIKLAIQKPDYCWGAGGGARGYGIGFDQRSGPAFNFSDGTVMHEGAGACALYIDPKEELAAAWITPFVNREEWCTRAMYNTVNVIWSGII